MGSFAQTAPAGAGGTLPAVTVREQAEVPQTKNDLRVRRTEVGKGNQELRDIPQTVTVQTERLIDDRNLDDFREVLRTTAGVTFQAGETGEEDVRLRGFSLQQAGDIYRDGLRDAPLYERDTFNDDRIEVLKGSASMLFGRGSTGGIVNQASKQPFLMGQHEVDYTIGTGRLHRLTGDFNFHTGENAAFRLNAMVHEAENWGAEQSKRGIAPTYRWGIGTRDEFSVGLFHLDSEGRPLYNHPWIIEGGVIQPLLPARNYYGLGNDRLDTRATFATVSHVHRFDHDGQLKTQLRHGRYERDLLASAIGFASPTTRATLSDATVLRRTPKARTGISELTQLASDYSGNFNWGGRRHELLAGVDLYRDEARRNNNFTAGLAPAPTTTVGTPDDGAVRPDTRGPTPFDTFDARNIGLYAQDLVSITPTVKLLGGLRFDHFRASFDRFNGATGERSDSLWSPRAGLIWQPGDTSSYYVSYGTSYNTSGDTYQFAPAGPSNRLINTAPEKSRNLEVGAKWEVFDGRALLGVAAFHTEKYNERNTDPDTTASQELLSGKRHATGMEFNLAGRFTPRWEVFFNHTWIPEAEIDESNVVAAANGGGSQVEGDRPALTPRHSGSLWTTYRILPKLRVGAGVNYRGSQNPEGARNIRADSFYTVDAMAEYSFTEMVSARLNLTNLTDELYADGLYRGFYTPGTPRRAELTLKTLF
ncbi:TonB-dependent receptor [Ramlibacter tataouinensis]|uniref:Outer membrane protein, TonB-dependent receptor-like protein n=1 Tax=Ramlibacter tataouinensis (strain ATCC BAA-407 / DSM 14655 / LMG 21543 / TTB310) TaxID=365046 RepID=F5Y1T6_RAMTT|nr:TonB-dependent siderophore receptor [Ramlibacter tataouinensis]AEG93520.1 outer membrane protein precursor, TonB-dependent receptor-like protein [Ramlibacter tataouinensis TTB310]